MTLSAEEREARAAALPKRETRTLTSDIEVYPSSDTVRVSGYASTFDQPYDMAGWYTEVVRPGAFAKTLSEDPDVRLLLNHDGLPLARTKSGTLKLSEDATGLYWESDLDVSDPDVQRVLPKMRRGDLNQCSFAFTTIRDSWSPDYTQRDMLELSLRGGDVSIVTYPANPNAEAALRALPFDPEQLAAAYAELRAGKSISADNAKLIAAAHSAMSDLLAQCDVADLGDMGASENTPDDEAASEVEQQGDDARTGGHAGELRTGASSLFSWQVALLGLKPRA